MTDRDNYLRNASFQFPAWTPINVAVSLASLIRYKKDMEEVMARYPDFFPGFEPGKIDYTPYGDGTCDIAEDDAWGYQWHYTKHGIEGCTINPPIDDWSKLATYKAPDADIWLDRGGKRGWEKELAEIAAAKDKGELTSGGLEFFYGIFPPTDPDQVVHVCDAFRQYRTCWADK